MTQQQAKAKFLAWLRFSQPALYSQAIAQPMALSGFWDTVTKVFDSVSNTVVKAGTAYVQGRAALDLVKANVARAKQGLAPLNSMDELNAQQSQPFGMFSSIPPIALYAGIGLIAFLILRRR
jgi:hypothetical protein